MPWTYQVTLTSTSTDVNDNHSRVKSYTNYYLDESFMTFMAIVFLNI